MNILNENITKIRRTLVSNVGGENWFGKISGVPDKLFHYTTGWAGHEIVTSHTMRATHAAYLNDGSELNYAFEVIRRAIGRLSFDFPVSEVTVRVVQNFESYASLIANHFGIESDIYLTSFTSRAGSLSQYRMYGGDTSGVCLEFDPRMIEDRLLNGSVLGYEPRGKIAKCIYDPRAQIDLVWKEFSHCIRVVESMNLEFIGDDSDGVWLNELFSKICFALYPLSASIKHPSFSDEDEYRAIFLRRPILIGHSGFSEKNGLIRQHIVWKFGTENPSCKESGWPPRYVGSALTGVEIGPGGYKLQNYRSFNRILQYNAAGLKARLFDSPYRG